MNFGDRQLSIGPEEAIKEPEYVGQCLRQKASGPWLSASLQLASTRVFAYRIYWNTLPVAGTFQRR